MNFKIIKSKMRVVLFLIMMVVCPALYGQTTLNNILSTYSTNIKVCNAPYATNCIYDTHYMRVNKQDNFINIEYGFGWDEKRGYITTNRIRINLSTVTFYTGYWYNSFGKWENLGKKNELTIEDENGIDLYITGQQNYNQGTKQNCVSLIKFDFGTEPIANQVLKELLALQETYKGEAPWLLPFTSKNKDNINTPESTNPSKTSNSKKTASRESKTKQVEQKKSKSGKYEQ